ncbi:hypothetical protein Tco_0198767 [Tanacetum coccineum]
MQHLCDTLQRIPCSPECKIVGQILLNHPLSYALTATANVLVGYLQQFWRTVSKVPDTEDTIKFMLDTKEFTYTVDMFRVTLHLQWKLLKSHLVRHQSSILNMEAFMYTDGYQCVDPGLPDIKPLRTVILQCSLIKPMIWMPMDSDVMNLNSAKIALFGESFQRNGSRCTHECHKALDYRAWTDIMEEVKDLKEMQNVENSFSGSNEKALDKEAIETHFVDPKVSKDNVEPITPKLLNKRTAHSSYIKHTQEEALVLRDIVEHVKANYPQDSLLESAFRYTKVIQELLSHISRTCPSINNFDPQLVAVTPRKKDKKVRFAESLTSTENTKIDSTSNIVSNKRVLHSTGVRLSTSASGSQPSGNTRNDKIQQTPSSNSKNKVEAHPRNVKSSLNKRNGTVKVNGSASVQNSKKHDNSDYVCINDDDCMSSDNLCVSNSMNDVKFRAKPKKKKSKEEIWKPTGKVFPNRPLGSWTPVARSTMTGDRSQLTIFISIILGLGHNLFYVGQFCDSNLEVAFRQHTCFIRNLEGVDLLMGSRGDNLYTLSLGNMMGVRSPILSIVKGF